MMRVQITEHRFDDAEPPAVPQPPLTRIDPGPHGLGLGMHLLRLATVEEGGLPIDTDIRLSQTLASERTGAALR